MGDGDQPSSSRQRDVRYPRPMPHQAGPRRSLQHPDEQLQETLLDEPGTFWNTFGFNVAEIE